MKKITQENKDQILTDNPKVVVKFGASWCGPCKAYDRILYSIQSDDLPLYSCEVEDATEWFTELGIKAVPATLVFENGVEVNRLGGIQSADTIAKLLV